MLLISMVLLGVLLALGVIAFARREPDKGTAPAPALAVPIPERLRPQVLALVGEHKKIEAIKLVREQTGLGLKEAKDSVEALESGRGFDPSARAPDLNWLAAEGEARRLWAEGRPIDAVQHLREHGGMRLSEAKALVDAFGDRRG